MIARWSLIQPLVASAIAPVPPAISLAGKVYGQIAPEMGLYWGLIAAVTGAITMELVGGSACFAAMYFADKKDYSGRFIIAVVAILAYVISGAYMVATTPILIPFFLLSTLAYILWGAISSDRLQGTENKELMASQLALAKLQVNRTNAEARLARAQSPGATPIVSQSVGGSKEKEVFALLNNPESGIFNDKGEPSIRAVARALNISPSTSKIHIDKWKKR